MNRDFWRIWERAEFEKRKDMIKRFFGVDTTIVYEDLTLMDEMLSDLLISKNEEMRYFNNEGIKKLTEQRNKILTGDFYGDQFDIQKADDFSGDEYKEDDSQITQRLNNPGAIVDDK
jgi:hypothetical protein